MAKRGKPRKVVKKQTPVTKSSNDFIAIHKKPLIIGSLLALAALLIVVNPTQKDQPTQDIATPTPTTSTADIQSATPSAQKTISPTPSRSIVNTLPATHSDTIFYITKKGDSLAKIGTRVCGNKNAWASIAETNNIYYPYTLAVGQEISISCN